MWRDRVNSRSLSLYLRKKALRLYSSTRETYGCLTPSRMLSFSLMTPPRQIGIHRNGGYAPPHRSSSLERTGGHYGVELVPSACLGQL